MNRSHRAPRRDGRAAFTLIEILIAVFILALGLVFVFTLFPVGIYCTRDNLDDTQASFLAQTALGRMQAARVIDRFDTPLLAVLDQTDSDVVAALRTGKANPGDTYTIDGFTVTSAVNELKDAPNSLYYWMATYARPNPDEVATDTSPADALRVRVAVLRGGPNFDAHGVLDLTSAAYAGRVLFQAGSDKAALWTLPADRSGLVPGNYVCDMRSGAWYLIRDITDRNGDGTVDQLEFNRPVEFHSVPPSGGGNNAYFFPNVVTVYDGMLSR